MIKKENRPDPKAEPTSRASDSTIPAEQLHLRRTASWRLYILDSGRADPWYYEPPSAGYELAAAHLLELGLTPAPNLPALRLMWKAGGDSRYLADIIAKTWELAAA